MVSVFLWRRHEVNNRTQRLVFARTPWFDDQAHPSSPQSTHPTAQVNRLLKPKVLGAPGLTSSKNATRNKDATSSFLFLVAMHLLRFHPSNQREVHHLPPSSGPMGRTRRNNQTDVFQVWIRCVSPFVSPFRIKEQSCLHFTHR